MDVPRSRVGTRFGPYEVRSLLGRGGMGEVYEAFDTGRDRVVALKILPEQLAQDATYQDRFRRESQAAARLAEPHIIPIHDWGETGGSLFLDMRLVRGENLRTLLRRQGKLDTDRAVAIVEQVAAALDAAHAAGLVHRDVKPANILVTPADFAYLTDFGIARDEGDNPHTTGSHAAGSYTYMAPERFDSGPVTARADIYSLACVLHECLTGATPFPAESVSVLIRSHLSEPPPRASAARAGVPEAIDDVIARAMAKAPADRYQTAGQFAAAARAALGLGGRMPAESSTTGTPFDSGTPKVFGAELLANTPRGANPSGGPDPVSVAAARDNDYRRTPEPTTFQPFGPDGPTIAANFQPRSSATAGATATDGAAAPTDSANTDAAQPVSAASGAAPVQDGPVDANRPAGTDAPAATSRAYETTGTLRIIPPPSKDERDTSGDLPIIRPADPTLVKPGEFHFTLPAESAAAQSKPATLPSLPMRKPPAAGAARQAAEPVVPRAAEPPRRPAAESTRAYGVIGSEETRDHTEQPVAEQDSTPGSEYRTQLLDPAQFSNDPEVTARSGADTALGSDADLQPGEKTELIDVSQFRSGGADRTPGAEDNTRFLDVSQFGTVAQAAGDTQFLDVGRPGDEDYGDDTRYDDDLRYRDDAQYDEDDRYDEARYEDDDRYAADDYSDDEYAFAATGSEDARPAKRSRSVAVPVVLGVLAAAVLAGLGVVGWQVFGSSGSSDHPATAAAPAAPAVTAQQPVTSSAPRTSAAPTTTGTSANLPVGATPCSQTSTSQGSFGKTATGSEVTSCGFAEAVRKAYAQAAESHGATSAATAEASTSIIAVSPVTGRSYPMTCTSSGKVVTCTGGDNAVVYVY
ncbi:serine/threonine-protein kinase [Nocardia kruczakiae]|uniref:non-specific serine/threonine protein kinase n=1 Tax=Nocardia kruczakiae TaxID=261477 RepID=A0ABU1XDK7_9NOCA|nr:protein kinase [Nocardia kruczakiae]MDR7168629.1 serine/threonine-protein kinase [Nocardia kruczakiae]